MKAMMADLRKKVKVGLVGGSDFVKIQEQMGGDDGEAKPKLVQYSKNHTKL
jgi:hypothetical protein